MTSSFASCVLLTSALSEREARPATKQEGHERRQEEGRSGVATPMARGLDCLSVADLVALLS